MVSRTAINFCHLVTNEESIWINNSDMLKHGSLFSLIDCNLKVIAVKFAIPFAFLWLNFRAETNFFSSFRNNACYFIFYLLISRAHFFFSKIMNRNEFLVSDVRKFMAQLNLLQLKRTYFRRENVCVLACFDKTHPACRVIIQNFLDFQTQHP